MSINTAKYKKTPKKSANWPSTSKGNLLSLSPCTLTKHPSAKNLETFSDHNTRSESFSSSSKSNANCLDKNDNNNILKSKYFIDIEQAEDTSYSKDDNYYIRNDDISNIKSENNNIKATNSSSINNADFYGFSSEQMKIDELITKNIQKGSPFEEIEKSFQFYSINKNGI